MISGVKLRVERLLLFVNSSLLSCLCVCLKFKSVTKVQKSFFSPTPIYITPTAYAKGENNYVHNSVERYDVRTNSWDTMKIMPMSRLGFGIAAIEERIFLVGGMTGETALIVQSMKEDDSLTL